jgi:hypothetical protein
MDGASQRQPDLRVPMNLRCPVFDCIRPPIPIRADGELQRPRFTELCADSASISLVNALAESSDSQPNVCRLWDRPPIPASLSRPLGLSMSYILRSRTADEAPLWFNEGGPTIQRSSAKEYAHLDLAEDAQARFSYVFEMDVHIVPADTSSFPGRPWPPPPEELPEAVCRLAL